MTILYWIVSTIFIFYYLTKCGDAWLYDFGACSSIDGMYGFELLLWVAFCVAWFMLPFVIYFEVRKYNKTK